MSALQWLLSVEAFQWLTTAVGIGMSAGPLVQAWKIWRARSARDVSLFNFALFGAGCSVWLVWGLRSNNLPLVVANGPAVLIYVVVVGLILRYRTSRRIVRLAEPSCMTVTINGTFDRDPLDVMAAIDSALHDADLCGCTGPGSGYTMSSKMGEDAADVPAVSHVFMPRPQG